MYLFAVVVAVDVVVVPLKLVVTFEESGWLQRKNAGTWLELPQRDV